MMPRDLRCRNAGFGMIEVLVTLIILLVGLLGLAGLMLQSQRAEMESYQRVQALVLLQDMAGRINGNRKVATCYATTGLDPAYLGTGGAAAPDCAAGTTDQNLRAKQDMTDWGNLLAGAAESGSSGAMVGGRGCISYAAGVATVSVAWQGLAATAPPPAALTCGQGLYGNESMRRVVSMPVQFANLSAP
ncbi:MAG TPA: type IV pilus modification protein PilV [Rhodocyclaceae bacterium]